MSYPETWQEKRIVGAIRSVVPPKAWVLDCGAGMGPYLPELIERADRVELLDAHLPYLMRCRDLLRAENADTAKVLFHEGVAPAWLEQQVERFPVPATSRDVVLGLDFIEHLEMSDALRTIAAMKKLAPRIGLFVPVGCHPQDKDVFRMGADTWQTHRSTWDVAALEKLGFDVELWPGFHSEQNPKAPNAMWAVWRA